MALIFAAFAPSAHAAEFPPKCPAWRAGTLPVPPGAITGGGTLVGTPKADLIIATAPGTTIIAGAGNDTVCADGPVSGGPGDDIIDGPGTLHGDAGNDALQGGGMLYGDGDDDELLATVGSTSVLNGGLGNDKLHAYEASPRAVYGGPGNDQLDLHMVPSGATVSAGPGNDLVSVYAAFLPGVTVQLGDGDDGYDGTLNGNDRVDGGPGDDWISGDAPAGDDWDLWGSSRDTLIGGPGDDTLIGGYETDILRGGPGKDRLIGDHFEQEVAGYEPFLVDWEAEHAECMATRPGPNCGPQTLTFEQYLDGLGYHIAWGDDRLYGDGEDDILSAGPGRDTLSGGTGADQLRGGRDNDRLLAGGGDADAVLDCGLGTRDIIVFDSDADPAPTGCEQLVGG